MKLNELKAMLRAWKKTKSIRNNKEMQAAAREIASDICAFLCDNLELEDE